MSRIAKIIKIETVTINNATGQIASPEPSSQEKLMDSIFGENRKWIPVQLYSCLGEIKAKNLNELSEKGYELAGNLGNNTGIEFFMVK